MDYAYRLFKNVQFFYSTLNPATLSGAIDLIVVEQPDGSYMSTPFHVRFGKYGVFNSNEKYVDITINGEEIDLKMKLGENGVAFFAEQTQETDVPDYLVTSPVPGSSPTPDTGAVLEESAKTLREHQARTEQKRVLSECSSISRSPSPNNRAQPHLNQCKVAETIDKKQKKSLPFKASLFSQRNNRSLPNLSQLTDIETTVYKNKDSEIERISRKKLKHSFSTVDNRSLTPPPTSRRKVFDRLRRERVLSKKKRTDFIRESLDSDSDDGTSSTSSLGSSGASRKEGVDDRKHTERDLIADGALSDSEVDRHRNAPQPHGSDVTEWKWGELPKTRDEAEKAEKAKVMKEKAEAEKKKTESSWSDWFRWSRPKPDDDQGIYLDDLVGNSANDPSKIEKYLGRSSSSACPSPPFDSGNFSVASPSSTSDNENENATEEPTQAESSQRLEDKTPTGEKTLVAGLKSDGILSGTAPSPSVQPLLPETAPTKSADRQRERSGRSKSPTSDIFPMSDEEAEASTSAPGSLHLDRPKSKYIRSLKLSSERLKKLGLRRGPNEARFSITTKFQGTCWCSCHIYLYKWYDRIVISDIDGTITKSDVLGHVIPAIGGQWAHAGVAELYTRIKENGYKMVYLSSRAIGQSYYTKKYLQSIAQDSRVLPDGPLFLSPTSVLMAFRREVIDRKPEEFKIAALSDLKECFPVKQPFYAGFGNRDTDVVSYRAVNIPPERIMIIDKTGRVRRADGIGFETSYMSLAMDSVDYMFPPLVRQHSQRIAGSDDEQHLKATVRMRPAFTKPHEFSDFTHWRIKPNEMRCLDNGDLLSYENKRKILHERNKKKPKK